LWRLFCWLSSADSIEKVISSAGSEVSSRRLTVQAQGKRKRLKKMGFEELAYPEQISLEPTMLAKAMGINRIEELLNVRLDTLEAHRFLSTAQLLRLCSTSHCGATRSKSK
jgi:hypothetical protein